jgi:hypothetical protein
MAYLITGRSVILIFGGSKGAVKEVNALRRLSETRAEGDLPIPQFPNSDIRRMKKVRQTFKATGSIRVAANRLGLSVSTVRDNLRLARNIEIYGDYETVDCSREEAAR